MAFRKDISIDSDQLMGDLGRLEETADRARLAGFGLAAPLLELRLAQQRREIARIAARRGADHPEVAARQAALGRGEARVALFREELQRARLDRPTLAENAAGLWGRVVENGNPVEGATVIAAAAGKRIDFRCTGPTGGFAFQVPPDASVVLSVRAKDGAEVHRDAQGTTLKAGQQQYREIDLARGVERPCPEPPSDTPPRDDRFPMVDLVGQREAAAIALLRAQGLALAARKEQPAEGRVGIVVAQDPTARSPVKPGDGVTLAIGIEPGTKVPTLVGLNREAAEAALKRADLLPGQARTASTTREKVGLVLEQSPAEGATVARGSTVVLTIGALGGETPGRPTRDPIVAKLASRAEDQLRQAGVGKDAEQGHLAVRLTEAGVHDTATLDKLLATDRQEVRRALGLRTLAETDKTIAALKRERAAKS